MTNTKRVLYVVLLAKPWGALTHPVTGQEIRVVGEDVPDMWMPVFFSKEAAERAYPGRYVEAMFPEESPEEAEADPSHSVLPPDCPPGGA